MATLFDRLAGWLIARITRRAPDFIIGGAERPYLLRWFVIPRNAFLNIYLHQFLRSDDDRALHDHPWGNISILLRGSYIEHTIAQGGIHLRTERRAGQWKIRPLGTHAHRLELHDGYCWTLFLTGPRYREWGFHCPERGWVHWEEFTAPGDKGAVGRGCD